MPGLQTGARLSCPGPVTPVGSRGDVHLLPTCRSAALGSHGVCVQPWSSATAKGAGNGAWGRLREACSWSVAAAAASCRRG